MAQAPLIAFVAVSGGKSVPLHTDEDGNLLIANGGETASSFKNVTSKQVLVSGPGTLFGINVVSSPASGAAAGLAYDAAVASGGVLSDAIAVVPLGVQNGGYVTPVAFVNGLVVDPGTSQTVVVLAASGTP